MIDAQQWWSIIEDYGAQIWPAQAVFTSLQFCLPGGFLSSPVRSRAG